MTHSFIPENKDKGQLNRDAHEQDDVDVDTKSHHHTLGNGATQAAPGKSTYDRLIALEQRVALLESLHP